MPGWEGRDGCVDCCWVLEVEVEVEAGPPCCGGASIFMALDSWGWGLGEDRSATLRYLDIGIRHTRVALVLFGACR